jgi:secreted PhoX family phosphatase
MSDGNLVPLAHDGMASFVMPDGTIRLVRNHEDRNSPGNGSTGGNPATKYDPLAGGGTTTLVIDPAKRELVRDFISLNGTIVNCAGGWTPWGSWLTCEETNAGTPQGWGAQHGYAFDVPAAANATVQAVPRPALGRFAHEAIAVDPNTWIIYETEDSGSTSGFYRFVSSSPGNLNSGKLQMLKVAGVDNYDTRTGQVVGVQLPVEWVDIAVPNPPGQGSEDVYNQGAALGGARFSRLEGCWYGNGSIFFVSTDAGDAGAGQVWEYRPAGATGTLSLVFESPSSEVLDAPDNLTVSPRGSILLCEDGDDEQYLRAVTPDGEIFDFALNLMNEDEWAGATFAVHGPSSSANHVTLFVNLFGVSSGPNPPNPARAGMTLAIWGPWNRGAL